MNSKNETASGLASNTRHDVDIVEPAPQETTLSPSSILVPSRSDWVDVARGLGIILVVYGHALRGNYRLTDAESWQAVQDRLIYFFHMPLFFVLAGLFLWNSIGKDRRGFLAGRWEQIIYPYLLWSAITGAIKLPLAHFVNSPIDWHEIWQIPFKPIEQYWFLYALLVHQLTVAIIFPRKWLLLAAMAVGLGLFAWFGGGWIVLRSMLHLPFLVTGIFAVPLLHALAGAAFAARALVATGGWLSFAAIYASGILAAVPIAQVYALGVSGSVGLIATAMLLSPATVLARPFVLLGQASLAIYVAHTVFSAGVRIGLNLIGIAPETAISFAAANVVGLLFPLILWRVALAQGWSRWIGFGR
ncbi:MAG: acyltransferase [Sphingopyxis sp.]|nr:acyltransferase [Sphingopyxis sp.]